MDLKVLVYGINYSPELTGIGKYTGEMAPWLTRQGHDVCAVTAPPYYPEWQVHAGYRNAYHDELIDGVRVCRCPLYVPSKPTTLKRFLHLSSFAISSFFMMFRLLFWRPQVVVLVEPTLFCAPAALLYAFLVRARTVLHIQDFEVDAMFGLGMALGSGRIARLAGAVDGWFMRRFDRVSTISKSMMRHAESKGVSPQSIWFFPNWVDTGFIRTDVDRSFFRKRWCIGDQIRVVLYSGNMGKKQGLELVVQAAESYRSRPDVLFLMVGQGAAHDDLKRLVVSAGLENVRFESLQPYELLPELLALADIHLVIQRKGAADVVLPSKLTTILSAGGNALITAEADTELGLLVESHPGIAFLAEAESLPAFLAKLDAMLASDLPPINPVARSYAVRFLGKDEVLAKFEQQLKDLAVRPSLAGKPG
jgi:colanic acid biosynthesis glycosyl transferase WcaI